MRHSLQGYLLQQERQRIWANNPDWKAQWNLLAENHGLFFADNYLCVVSGKPIPKSQIRSIDACVMDAIAQGKCTAREIQQYCCGISLDYDYNKSLGAIKRLLNRKTIVVARRKAGIAYYSFPFCSWRPLPANFPRGLYPIPALLQLTDQQVWLLQVSNGWGHEKLSTQEIAKRLCITHPAARERIKRAVQKMALALEKYSEEMEAA